MHTFLDWFSVVVEVLLLDIVHCLEKKVNTLSVAGCAFKGGDRANVLKQSIPIHHFYLHTEQFLIKIASYH
jgi:hypothetical protein